MIACDALSCAVQLFEKNRILILIHANPDGDCIGSASALCAALLALGKEVRIVCPHTLPERLAFICSSLPQEVLCFGADVGEDFAADLVASADVASPELLGRLRERYEDKINLCIDHHMINTVKADAMLRKADSAACGEIILEICDELSRLSGKNLLTKEISDMLYAAISSDSGSFKYGNTTAKTLLYASRLKSVGADSEVISRLLFDTKSLAQYKLTGLVIPKTEFLSGGRLAYCLLLDEELSQCGATKEDCDGITQIFREVNGVEVSVFAKQHNDSESGENRVKMSLRSNSYINCAKICECFGGGGHIKAAGCTIKGESCERARELILGKIAELYPEL